MTDDQALSIIKSWGYQFDMDLVNDLVDSFVYHYETKFPLVENYIVTDRGFQKISWIIFELVKKEKISRVFKLYTFWEFVSEEVSLDVDGICLLELGVGKVYGKESLLLHHNIFKILSSHIPLLISVSDLKLFEENVPDSLIELMKGRVKRADERS